MAGEAKRNEQASQIESFNNLCEVFDNNWNPMISIGSMIA